jgi:beta-phosphoglucomutase-like phosphatase (HAD superfamily)
LKLVAVIFDLDGVIVESEQVWDRVRRRFVEKHGGTWREDSSRLWGSKITSNSAGHPVLPAERRRMTSAG